MAKKVPEMKCIIEGRSEKNNFTIILRDEGIVKKLGTSVLEGEIWAKGGRWMGRLDPNAFLKIGKTKFADIDRRYFPTLGTFVSEATKMEFILRDSLYPKLEQNGYIESELPTGKVVIQVGK